jgi:hypothetical protein
MNRYSSYTSVIICGCSSGISSPALFPPLETSEDEKCLATSSVRPLRKRNQVFSHVIGYYTFTCHLDAYQNPFQDCLNAMARICNPNYMGYDKILINACKNGVNSMAGQMNIYWRTVRKACGQWSLDGPLEQLEP